jgi:hypothetical protein
MSKLNRRELDETTEETETEAMQPILTNPYEGADRIGLKCTRCEHILDATRGLEMNLTCPRCGKDRFIALNEFRMISPNKEKTVFVNDVVERGSYVIWKLV